MAGPRSEALPLGRISSFKHQLQTPIGIMKKQFNDRAGKIKYALLGWLIGLPLPIVLILLFVRGCDF